jgi:hypothetical protein
VAVANQRAGQLEQAEVDVTAALVADAESFEGVQPGETALDHPAVSAQTRAVRDAAAGDPRQMTWGNPSARRIFPELQASAPGDVVSMDPGGTRGLAVHLVDPPA